MLKKFNAELTLLLCLSVLTIAISLSSCRKAPEKPSSVEPLTGIFTQAAVAVPEDFGMLPYVTPYAAPDGTLTVFSMNREFEETEDETVEHMSAFLTDLSPDGEILSTTEIPTPHGFVYGGVITSEAVYMAENKVDSIVIFRFDRSTGELSSTEAGPGFFGHPDFPLNCVCADGEGRIYCSDYESVVVLDSDLALICSLDFPTPISSMAKGADGTIWAAYRDGRGAYAVKVDPEKREIGKEIPFMTGQTPSFFLLIDTVGETEENALVSFYYADDTAIRSVSVDGEKAVETTAVDLIASGISRLYNRNDYYGWGIEGLYLAAMIGSDGLIAARCSEDGRGLPELYYRGDEIPEENQSIILAHSEKLEPKMISLIRDWNAAHPDTRIETVDYSGYRTEEDYWFGAEAKICFDMLNGGFRPDIVLTGRPAYRRSDRSVMSFVNRHDLYVDLTPYLETDDTLNFDTLYGFVPRCFDDGRGGIWGITTGFTVETVQANPNFLGEIADKGFWTVEEWLDVYESLPPDTAMYYRQLRAWGVWMYTKEGYAAFMKDGVCSFDSPLFVRFLKFMRGVPKDLDEWKRTSPFSELTADELYRQGRLVVDITPAQNAVNYFGYHTLLNMWKEEEAGRAVPVGFATDSGFGGRVNPYDIIVITKYARDPDLCFEAVKSLFSLKHRDPCGGGDPMFSQKTLEEEAAELELGETLREYAGEEYYERMNRFFDEGGSPMLEYVPEAIYDIIEEEASAYYAGLGTAEDCAKKIQSRASIWMAEHR